MTKHTAVLLHCCRAVALSPVDQAMATPVFEIILKNLLAVVR